MREEWDDEFSDMVRGWGEDDLPSVEGRRGRLAARARVIPLFAKRAFDYTFLAGSATQTVTIKRALNVVPFFYYLLMVRVHNTDIEGSGATLTLRAYDTLPSSQDPQEFTDGIVLTQQVTQATPVPSLLVDASSDHGPFFKVQLVVQQGATPGDRLYAELSAVLYGRAVG